MNIPRKHHWVPDFFLKRFANPDGLFWVADLIRNQLRLQSTVLTCAENHRNTLLLENGERDVSLERWMADIEAPVQAVLSKLDRREPLSNEDRRELSTFVALQAVRTPDADNARDQSFLKRLQKTTGSPTDLRRAMMALDDQTGFETISEQESPPDSYWIQAYSDLQAGRLKLSKHHQRALSVVMTGDLAVDIFHKGWSVVHVSAGTELVVSSNPVFSPNGGYCMPLGPTMALHVSELHPEFAYAEAMPETVKRTNHAIAELAESVLCSVNKDLLEELLQIRYGQLQRDPLVIIKDRI